MIDRINPRILRFLLIIITLAASFVFLNKDVSHNVRNYSELDNELVKQDNQIKKILGFSREFHFFVLKSKSIQGLLEKEEKLKETYLNDGVFLSDWAPSMTMQKKSLENYSKLLPTIEKVRRQVGLKKEFEFLKPDLISFENWGLQGLDIYDQWIGKVGSHHSLVVPILSPNIKSLNSGSDIIYYHKTELINSLISKFYDHVIVGFGFFLALLACFLFYKFGMSNSFYILTPPLFAVSTSLAVVAIFSQSINIFHLLGGILVFALAIDYSFFYFFNKDVSESVSLSAITTLLSFGALCLSATYAVSSFGFIIVLGILSIWIVSPLSRADSV